MIANVTTPTPAQRRDRRPRHTVMNAQPLQIRRSAQVLSALTLVLATSCAGPAQAGAAPAAPQASMTPTPDAPAAAPAVAEPAVTTLRRGDAGPEVLALQQRLDALGYWLGTPDGSFGGLTEQAVYALQGAAGLTRDGAVGPGTRDALDAGVLPAARSDHGAVTEIDRNAGVISFVQDGEVRLVMHTSTGTSDTYRHDGRRLLADTPVGTFTVSWSFDGWREGDLGRLYRPRYFHPDGIAVHGYPSVPAYPASHGCARVTEAAMDMIWARGLMPRGSTVRVF
ncbi:L,D-transpeptidase family protein [Pseudonocardia saturnea]